MVIESFLKYKRWEKVRNFWISGSMLSEFKLQKPVCKYPSPCWNRSIWEICMCLYPQGPVMCVGEKRSLIWMGLLPWFVWSHCLLLFKIYSPRRLNSRYKHWPLPPSADCHMENYKIYVYTYTKLVAKKPNWYYFPLIITSVTWQNWFFFFNKEEKVYHNTSWSALLGANCFLDFIGMSMRKWYTLDLSELRKEREEKNEKE